MTSNSGLGASLGSHLNGTMVLPMDKFEAKPDQDYSEFIMQYEMYSESFGWTDELRMKRLPLHLKGIALSAFTQITDDDDKADWASLKDALEERLLVDPSGKGRIGEFNRRRQRKGESVQEYACALQKLALRAYADEDTREDALLAQFCYGVIREIQNYIIVADPSSYKEAVTKARKIEVNFERLENVKKPQDGQPLCFACQRYGHMARSCPNQSQSSFKKKNMEMIGNISDTDKEHETTDTEPEDTVEKLQQKIRAKLKECKTNTIEEDENKIAELKQLYLELKEQQICDKRYKMMANDNSIIAPVGRPKKDPASGSDVEKKKVKKKDRPLIQGDLSTPEPEISSGSEKSDAGEKVKRVRKRKVKESPPSIEAVPIDVDLDQNGTEIIQKILNYANQELIDGNQFRQDMSMLLTPTVNHQQFASLLDLLITYAADKSPHQNSVRYVIYRYADRVRAAGENPEIIVTLQQYNQDFHALRMKSLDTIATLKRRINEIKENRGELELHLYGRTLLDYETIYEVGMWENRYNPVCIAYRQSEQEIIDEILTEVRQKETQEAEPHHEIQQMGIDTNIPISEQVQTDKRNRGRPKGTTKLYQLKGRKARDDETVRRLLTTEDEYDAGNVSLTTLLQTLLARMHNAFLEFNTNLQIPDSLMEAIRNETAKVSEQFADIPTDERINEIQERDILSRMMGTGISRNKIITAISYLLYKIMVMNGVNPNQEEIERNIEIATKALKANVEGWVKCRGGWISSLIQTRIQESVPIAHERVENPPLRQQERHQQPDIDLSWVIKILPILLLFNMMPKTLSITAYDCSQAKEGPIYSLLDLEKCPHANPASLTTTTGKDYYVYQESEFVKTKVKECLVRKNHFHFICGYWYRNSAIVEPTTPFEPLSISKRMCVEAFVTKQIQIGSIRLKAQKGKITNRRIFVAGSIDKTGYCKGESYNINGEILDNIVAIEDYQVELREYDALFELETGKMMTFPECDLYNKECDTGESIMSYEVDRNQCRLAFLKAGKFNETKGWIYKEEISKSRMDRASDMVNTPTIVYSADPNEGMRFKIESDTRRCDQVVFRTNYKGIFLSTIEVKKAKPKIDKSEIKPHLYFDNKIDFIYHFQQENIYTVSRNNFKLL